MNEADVQLKGLELKLNVMKSDIEQTTIKSINQVAFINIDCLMVVLELSLGVAVNCDNTEQIISNFTDKLDEQTLDDLMQITQGVLQKFGKDNDDSTVQSNTNNTMSMDNTIVAEQSIMLKATGSGIKGEDIDGVEASPLNRSHNNGLNKSR